MGSINGNISWYRGSLGNVPTAKCSWSNCKFLLLAMCNYPEQFVLAVFKCYVVYVLQCCLSSWFLNIAILLYCCLQLSYFIVNFIICYVNYSQINACNGFYCDQFKPNSNTKPKIWTEGYTGWLVSFSV